MKRYAVIGASMPRRTVTAASSTSLTITEATPPRVKIGDHIDVTYHQSAAGNVADTVDDEPGDS